MGHARRRAALALSAALASASLLATAAPAWAPTGPAWRPQGAPGTPNPPAAAEQCRDGGWRSYTDTGGYSFPNQGSCVSFVASRGQDETPAGPSPQFPGNPG